MMDVQLLPPVLMQLVEMLAIRDVVMPAKECKGMFCKDKVAKQMQHMCDWHGRRVMLHFNIKCLM